jgi:hypothetical protein
MNEPKHCTADDLHRGLPTILAAPADGGRLAAIVIRSAEDQRQCLESCRLTAARGVEGDRWAAGSWLTTDDGQPHPDVQVSLINTRLIELLAGGRERWELAGDNLCVDLDLSRANLPTGQRLAIGEAILEITEPLHKGCGKFAQRYGPAAVRFVNSEEGLTLRLRGVYAKVVQDGLVAVGDMARKVARV